MSTAFSLQVAQHLRERRLLPDRTRAVVALSGGVDSVVLLQVLHELAVRHRWLLHVAHFNHQLRGHASAADERWVRRLSQNLALPCTVGRENVARVAKERKVSVEMAARSCRHQFLAEVARTVGARRVVLAHHADDQIELFFLRLLRGSGLQGLQGMQWVSPSPSGRGIKLVRPLLDWPREALLEEARRRGLRWREDASNRECDPLRNRIRHELLPRIRQRFQPAIDSVVLRTMSILRDEGVLVDQVMDQWRSRLGEVDWEKIPPAIQRRWIHEQLLAEDVGPTFDLIERLRAEPNVAWSSGPGRSVQLDERGRLGVRTQCPERFRNGKVAAELRGARGRVNHSGREVQWRIVRGRGRDAWRGLAGPGVEVFDADSVGREIQLRHWRPGDRFTPIGLGQEAKLQDLFVAAKVPRAERRLRLVAERVGGEIFWVEGLRMGESCKVTVKTRRLLIWRWC